jgi:hypothetical protein
MLEKLTQKQEAFIYNVTSMHMNYTQAYLDAYGGEISHDNAKKSGTRLANTNKVASRIRDLAEVKQEAQTRAYMEIVKQDELDGVASSSEVREFWSRTMRDTTIRMRDRMYASELLAKEQRLFVHQIETTNLTATADLSSWALDDLKEMLAYMKKEKLSDGTDTS